jgi:hypothetical protein
VILLHCGVKIMKSVATHSHFDKLSVRTAVFLMLSYFILSLSKDEV